MMPLQKIKNNPNPKHLKLTPYCKKKRIHSSKKPGGWVELELNLNIGPASELNASLTGRKCIYFQLIYFFKLTRNMFHRGAKYKMLYPPGVLKFLKKLIDKKASTKLMFNYIYK